MPKRPILGVLVNPIAGMGGRVGLKGTDGPEAPARARALGAEPLAGARAALALAALDAAAVDVVAAAGAMGADACHAAGFVPAQVVPVTATPTADDTRHVAAALREAGADLVLFAGGDGTARDIASVLGETVPLLGVPAGVKMYSAVFATSPAVAGRLARDFLSRPAEARRTRPVEIMDIDEAALRAGVPAAALFGYARAPAAATGLQAPKLASGRDEEAELDALCRRVAAEMHAGVAYVVGPGTTMRRLMAAAGLAGTLVGVDVVLDGQVVATDAGEGAILAAIDGRPAHVIVGVLGGQGCLFGRGNQPISARVLARLGPDDISVLASEAKLASLGTRGLFVDTGDPAVDRRLAGHRRVRTGPARTAIVAVHAPAG